MLVRGGTRPRRRAALIAGCAGAGRSSDLCRARVGRRVLSAAGQGLVNQHDWNVLPDRIAAPALAADQKLAVSRQADGRTVRTGGTGENLDEFGIDHGSFRWFYLAKRDVIAGNLVCPHSFAKRADLDRRSCMPRAGAVFFQALDGKWNLIEGLSA